MTVELYFCERYELQNRERSVTEDGMYAANSSMTAAESKLLRARVVAVLFVEPHQIAFDILGSADLEAVIDCSVGTFDKSKAPIFKNSSRCLCNCLEVVVHLHQVRQSWRLHIWWVVFASRYSHCRHEFSLHRSLMVYEIIPHTHSQHIRHWKERERPRVYH